MMANNPKHSNEVRITGGSCRGRKIRFPAAEGLRPTADMVREKLFNWLGQELTGLHVLDLFAGSGALGLEAASRNAKEIVLVDNNSETVRVLKKNIATFGLGDKAYVCRQDGCQYLKQTDQKFDVVFLDPPFMWQDWPLLFPLLKECLSEKAFVYIEAANLPEFPEWLNEWRSGRSGKSKFAVLIYPAAA